MTEITMPRLSDSMTEGTILTWLKQEGEQVGVGDELVEIETDKATMAYESPARGALEIVANVGDTVPVGEVIAKLGVASDATGAPSGEPEPPAAEQPVEPVELEPARVTGNGGAPGAGAEAITPEDGASRVRATPLARRLARAHGVDLAELDGTGPRGRITRSDVAARAGVELEAPPARACVQTAAGEATPAAAPPAGAPEPGQAPTRELTRIQQPTRTQQLIARRMAEAKATIPHFQVQAEAEFDALLKLRAQLKADAAETQVVPSINDFIVKACALALRAHPRANGSYRDNRFELHERINIGVAVAADEALIVPTIFDADHRPLADIAAESRRLAERVRDGKVTPPELSGATFTVSNLGMFGMTAITPVINPPQAAILGVGAARELPAIVDGELVLRHRLTLTLSCDHRILYGADAARFLTEIRRALESPLRLML
jgi:pyruvate dehydrogenase E2 component (dihydrolipoyllysine-residue acetyltransferase)